MSTIHTTLTEHQLPRVDDWVIQRKEIDVKGRKFFGAGTKGAVEVKLRGSREAVKLMDEMRRLLPHHRHMYEQAMVNASYCYHPKFIGATNDDDIRPLLIAGPFFKVSFIAAVVISCRNNHDCSGYCERLTLPSPQEAVSCRSWKYQQRHCVGKEGRQAL